jgi:hypothetical protein
MAKNIDVAEYVFKPDMALQVEGRHLGNRPLFSSNIVSNISYDYDRITIRLDDKANLAWWLQIHLSKEQLKQILREAEEHGA